MIEFMSKWAESIVVSVIIVTIIEMILPKGSNSKYVKMMGGIFVLITIVSPFINKFINSNFNGNIDFEKYLEIENNEIIQTSANVNNDELVRKMYEENLKVDIKTKISQKGYVVGNINLEILNNKEYTLNKIDMKISGQTEKQEQNNSSNVTTFIENIENIKINIGKQSNIKEKKEQSVINESEKRKLKSYLSGVYEVSENNINIY